MALDQTSTMLLLQDVLLLKRVSQKLHFRFWVLAFPEARASPGHARDCGRFDLRGTSEIAVATG